MNIPCGVLTTDWRRFVQAPVDDATCLHCGSRLPQIPEKVTVAYRWFRCRCGRGRRLRVLA